MNETLLTIDVFDTVITRRVLFPRDLFILQAERSLEYEKFWKNPDEWLAIRVKAEYIARRVSPDEEITIDDIYEIILAKYNLSRSIADRLKQNENQIEIEISTRLNSGYSKIKNLLNSYSSATYVSDMYLNDTVIREILYKNRLPNLDLMVSSKEKKTKASGNAYKNIIRKKNIEAKNITHIGDNHSSDFLIPQRMGIKAVHFTQSKPNKYELAIYNNKHTQSILANSMIAAAIKIARNKIHAEENSLPMKAWNLGCNIVGPTSFFFSSWIIDRCISEDIHRIYFFARDGQTPYKIAKRIAAHRQLDLDIRYIYVSRQSLHLPALIELNEEVLEWIFDDDGNLTINRVFSRLKLNATELGVTLPYKPDYVLSQKEIENIKIWIKQDNIKNIIYEKAKTERLILKDYFFDNGLLDGQKFAIVDIGWHGRLQASLSRLLESFSAIPEKGISGFYVGLIKQPTLPKWSMYESFAFDDKKKYNQISRNIGIYEILFSADHETTEGYSQSACGVIPVFKKKDKPSNFRIIKTMQYGAMQFCKEALVADKLFLSISNNDKINITNTIFKKFLSYPDKEELDVISSIEFSSSQEGHSDVKLIGVTGKIEIILLSLKIKKPSKFLWLESEITLNFSGSFRLYLLKYVEMARCLMRKVRRLLRK